MAGADGGTPWRGRSNPFPHAAVASLHGPRADAITIETTAVAEARRVVSDYLNVTRAPDDDAGSAGAGSRGAGSGEYLTGKGRVCVIEGEYGTGKTHLALEILDSAEGARDGTDTRVYPHAVQGGGFRNLYAGLMNRIGLSEMLTRVRECYSDIVREELADRPYTGDLVARLRRDDVDPQLVVDRYGLKEGALRDRLRQRLRAVTDDGSFSRALMLLLQPELRQLAWDWLTGGVPGPVLNERGVTASIATDTQAMDALGVVARLHGQRNRRFVVVIDELEKLGAARERDTVAHGQAFKRLLEVFRAAGALLVLCGLPDIFEILPRDPGRVDAVIHPSALTAAETRWYVSQTMGNPGQAMGNAGGAGSLAPFTRESVDYIVYLTNGVARDVLRLCYAAFANAAETGEEVTSATVRQAALSQAPNGGAARVRSDVSEILEHQGWPAERNRVLGALPGTLADFWIPQGEHGAGCAVLVSDSVLDDDDARRLASRTAAIADTGTGTDSATGADSGTGRTVILVVGGYLPEGPRRLLSEAPGDRILVVYHVRTFAREFGQALDAAMERFGPARPESLGEGPAGEFRVLRGETERIARQQATTLRAVQDLRQQSDALARAVEELRRPPAPVTEAGRALPDRLDALFSRARQSLAAYGDVRGFLDRAFEATARRPGERFALIHRLRTPDAFNAVGIAAYLSDLLAGFRASVRSWLAAAA
ncbi:MAG: hypothetical protein J2P25_13455 [Nocardiopsaceae bacterium]|nr:hypothetical protein [Nocardiopsaceae bacterium]